MITAMAMVRVLYAQETVAVASVKEACELARTNNPDLEVFRLQEESARMARKAAKSYRLPTLAASFSGQDNRTLATTPLPGEIFGQPGEVVNAQFGQPYTYNAGITLSKSMLDISARTQAKMAGVEVDLQSANTAAYHQQLIQQTSWYYYALLISNKALILHEQDVQLADSILMISDQKRQQGLINESSYLQARILANNARENLSQTEARNVEYELQLKLLLGMDIDKTLDLQEELLPQSTDDLKLDMGFDQSLQVNQVESQLADLKVKQQKAAFLPKFSFESYWGQQQFRDDFGMSFDAADWSGFSYLGLSVNVPIFTGLSNKHQLKVAKIDQQMAASRLENNQRASYFQDEVVLRQFIGSRDRVKFTGENFELYQQNTQLSLQQYEEGLIGLDEYLTRFEDMLKAEQAYLNALNTMYSYYATILSRQAS